MSLVFGDERTSINSELSESEDSQNITGSLKESQNMLEDELEYTKENIFDIFNDIKEKKKKKVTFKDKRHLVTIIKVESYKKYNKPIEIGGVRTPNRQDSIIKKKRKDAKKKKDCEKDNDEICFDKDGDQGKSCIIY